jgi:formyltetrahydrofolate-dependent phosphoribosylglycinamide formyltransferase
MKRVAVLISGRGSNLQALLDAQGEAAGYKIVVVGSNVPDAYGLERARAAGVETIVIDHKEYKKDREAFERALDSELRKRDVEIVALAGFMRVLTPFFVRAWSGRMINIHPSLLPKYPGLHTHRRAIDAGDAEAGCTVHLVTEGVDEGPPLAQAQVPILPGDTPDDLAARILIEEHKLFPACLSKLANSF